MDNLLARQSCATPIALASPRSLNPNSLASSTKRCSANSYPSSSKASRCVALRHPATRIGAPNTSARKTAGRQKS